VAEVAAAGGQLRVHRVKCAIDRGSWLTQTSLRSKWKVLWSVRSVPHFTDK